MIKQTIATVAVASTPWWLFPGIDVMDACFSCWVIGQFLTGIPLGIAIAWFVSWLD